MSDETVKPSEVTPPAAPEAPKLPEGQIPEEAEINLLKDAHAFLQEFPIQGKHAHVWVRMLDNLALVANSLLVKQETAIKAAAKK